MSLRESQIHELAERVVELSRNYALWWLLVDHETHTEFKSALETHIDFFEPTATAHFQSLLVIMYQLLDSRSDSISIRGLLDSIRVSHPRLVAEVEERIAPHQAIFDRLASIRSKVYAHRDSNIGPEMVFTAANLSPNSIGACVDVLRDAMNMLFFSLLPNREPFEYLQEATHRADMARNDGRRLLEAASNNPRERKHAG